MDLPQLDDYRSLFLKQTPLLDVRAPIEFTQGAFPFAKNLPIINDAEREAIGKEYKNKGQDEAIELGFHLVHEELKAERVNQWQNFFTEHPDGVLYCFRGGMRSKFTQQFIYEQSGLIFPRVKGGYKAMRRFLIDELEASSKKIKPIMLGGRTGIGKTILLEKLNQKIDLEGLFHHRGSVFGNYVSEQPSQIDIENILSIELLKMCEQNVSQLVFEDEAPNIGSRRIPEILYKKCQQSPLIQLETPIEERVEITFNEYVTQALNEHQRVYGDEQGFTIWSDKINASIDKIQKRLGGVRYQSFKAILNDAFKQHAIDGSTELYKVWIKDLLVEYYDPMYDYQFSKKVDRVIFKGNQEEVLDYLSTQFQLT